MAYNQYSGYGGNPYGGGEQQSGGYGTSNPYGGDVQSSNPYGGGEGYGGAHEVSNLQQPTAPQHQSNYSQNAQESNYGGSQSQSHTNPLAAGNSYERAGSSVLSNQDFLSRVEAAKADIRTLTAHVGQIAGMHQRTLASPDSGSSTALESIVTQTQVLNTSIKDQIKFLETDAARSGANTVKSTQIGQLKTSFTKQLQEYRQEEANYEKRYREQIARQYRIVNPEASDSEVQEAANADWGNEGVFQTALKTNRTATASTVLGAVRARHNDIQKIEKTMLELQQLMEDLASAVVLQDEPIQQTEQHTENVKHDTEAGNVQLDKGIASARRARKMKWWCFFICLAIIIILALVLGLYFGISKKS